MHSTSNAPVIKTSQELDKFVEQYVANDLHGIELFQQWQAIREASLRLSRNDIQGDQVAGEDSY